MSKFVIVIEDSKTTKPVDYKHGKFYNFIGGIGSIQEASVFTSWNEAQVILKRVRMAYPFSYVIEKGYRKV